MAFGPPGTSAEENLSVVSGPLRPGSSLIGTLGTPEQAAEKLLNERIAKQGEREVRLPPTLVRGGGYSGVAVQGLASALRPQPQPLPTQLLAAGDAAAGVGATLSRQRPATLRLRVPGAAAGVPLLAEHLAPLEHLVLTSLLGRRSRQAEPEAHATHVGPPSSLPACLPTAPRCAGWLGDDSRHISSASSARCVTRAARPTRAHRPRPKRKP